VRDLSVRRGALRVVHGVSLDVQAGSITGLLGLNGAGKSSLLFCLAGALRAAGGSIRIEGEDVTRRPSWERCRRGVVLVPAGRQLFTEQSVEDNLLVGGHLRGKPERAAGLERVYELFPVLGEKRGQLAGALSGGQQQMLAVAQGLVRRPRLLMLDEPSAGLSPVLVDRVFVVVRRLCEAGTAVLLVEQLIEKALALADRVYALARGAIVLEAKTSEPDLPTRLEHAYLATAGT
jgi:branched-chain amino acid transport system ATP-binding protein